jgi:ribosomal protein S6--L-glutamate ligase
MIKRQPKKIIGRNEWVSMPELGLPAVKAKSDTGAKSSSLHAINIEPLTRDGEQYVRFVVHPIQKNKQVVRQCVAKVKQRRFVTSSNGEKERRWVVTTDIVIGDRVVNVDLTLTNRHKMTFRMLLGLDTIKKARMIVDPALSCVCGRLSNAEGLYDNDDKDVQAV